MVFVNDCFIPQYKLEVEISKNTLLETRTYVHKLLKEYLANNHLQLLSTIAAIVNEGILCPASTHIQLLLLRILRRLFSLGEEDTSLSASHLNSVRSGSVNTDYPCSHYIRQPLFLVLRNISLFSEGNDDELREAAMLAYKVMNDKNDLELASMIENSEDLRFLKNSRFFTSKAYAYS